MADLNDFIVESATAVKAMQNSADLEARIEALRERHLIGNIQLAAHIVQLIREIVDLAYDFLLLNAENSKEVQHAIASLDYRIDKRIEAMPKWLKENAKEIFVELLERLG